MTNINEIFMWLILQEVQIISIRRSKKEES